MTGIPQGTVSLTVLPINHVYCLTMDIIKGISIGMIICINDSIMRFQRNLKLFQPEIVLLVPMIIESLAGKLNRRSLALFSLLVAIIAAAVLLTAIWF